MEREKEIIYELMRQIIEERRELSRQYYDLKLRLDNFDKQSNTILLSNPEKRSDKIVSIHQQYERKRFPTQLPPKEAVKVPFERIAGYIIEILKGKDQPIPCKVIYKALEEDYHIYINYPNLVNNIMPKILRNGRFPVEKASRGYWEYKKKKAEN